MFSLLKKISSRIALTRALARVDADKEKISELDALVKAGVPAALRDLAFTEKVTLFEGYLIGYSVHIYVQGVGEVGLPIWLTCDQCCGEGCDWCNHRGGSDHGVTHHDIIIQVGGVAHYGLLSEALLDAVRDSAERAVDGSRQPAGWQCFAGYNTAAEVAGVAAKEKVGRKLGL